MSSGTLGDAIPVLAVSQSFLQKIIILSASFCDLKFKNSIKFILNAYRLKLIKWKFKLKKKKSALFF